jgi:hypothetical protein
MGVHTARILFFLVLPAVALVFAVAGFRHGREQQRLDRLASEIVGRPVEVRCPNAVSAALDASPDDGSVVFQNGRPADYADVDRYVCKGVLRFGDGGRDFRAIQSLLVLAHEAFHMKGYRDEAVTECYALQTVPPLAERLGATPGEASAVARFALANVHSQLPGSYHSPECRDGGALDLRPADPVFP